ncbi:VOC family protein [Actinopolyspora mortivallis]|uniref:VOC domain-containing protein n=1 Tax=Actinopolyspora mortivallis TaxID=33906 RepID=A0A2T0H1T8_ACTMO|nr:VOC family protein [Actinopolyspora mortivallis]PRW65331.1 hypothetical protein CEP50_02130 [Actinopolyspora mortivallis]
MPPHSTVCGLRRAELRSADPAETALFYRRLLDWTVLQSEHGFECWVGERRCATVRADGSPTETPRWRPVFAGASETAELTGPEDTPASMVTGRAQHGPWAPRPRRGEPCWIELHTSEERSADEFWSGSLFWSVRQGTPGVLYTVRDSAIAGRTAQRGSVAGTGWLCYFTVDELDRAAERVPELGGSVLERGHHDTLGRTLVIADADGAVSALVEGAGGWGG